MERKTALAIGLSIAAGVLDFLGFVGFGLFPLTWIALVPVLFAVRGVPPARALAYGVIFGTVGNLGGYYWLVYLLHQFAELSIALSLFGLFVLCLYQGLSLALVVWCVNRAKRDLGLAPIWTLAIAYPALELAFPMLFPFFIGASQYRFTAITQIVEVTGMLGLTVLIGMVNGAVYELIEARIEKRAIGWRRVGVAFGAFAAALIYGLVRLPMVDATAANARRVRVAMIQTNLGAKDKSAKMGEFIERHQKMAQATAAEHPDVDLIVWPETAYNRRLPRTVTNVRDEITLGVPKPMVIGALTAEKNGRYVDVYNSAIATSTSGDILGRFDKVKLLPFGETIPFVETFPEVRGWFPHSSTFARGKTLAHLNIAGASLLPMICYEDILPAFVRELWKHSGPANALINLTNDSWYGDSHEPLIHLALATFRAIETRRALIRATNTGISAFVDPAGRIVQRSGQWTQETIIGDVPVIDDGGSTIYMATGDVLGWIATAATLAGLYIAEKRRRERKRAEAAAKETAAAKEKASPRPEKKKRKRR